MKRNHFISNLLFLSLFLSFLIFIFIPIKTQAAKNNEKEELCNNLLHSTTTCKQGNDIYYTVKNKIYRYDTIHKKKTTIHTSNDFYLFGGLSIHKDKIYCTANRYEGTDFADYYLYSISLDGSHPTCIAKGEAPCFINNDLYFMKYGKTDFENYDMDPKGIYMISNSSKEQIPVIKAKNVIRCTTDGKYLYFCRSHRDNSFTWYAYSPSTKKTRKLITFHTTDINELSISTKNIYYFEGRQLYQYDVKTKKASKLLSLHDKYDTGNGTISNGFIYYGDQISNTKTYLYKYNIQTKKRTKILTMSGIGFIYTMGPILGFEKHSNTDAKYNTHLCLRLADGTVVTLKKFFVS